MMNSKKNQRKNNKHKKELGNYLALFFNTQSMDLLKNLRKLSNDIISNFPHWSQPALLTFGGIEYNIKCKYNRHNTTYDDNGMDKNTTNATIEVHVDHLKSVGVPFIEASGMVNLSHGSIVIKDTIATREYEISSTRPDATLGIIVCILQLKNNNYVTAERNA